MFMLSPYARRLVVHAALLACAVAWGPMASAAEPAAFEQVPGYYRQAIGELRVTALFDGVAFLPRNHMKSIAAKRAAGLLEWSYVPEQAAGIQTAVNAYLVRRGDTRILVDAGTADCFGPTLGRIGTNLRSAGEQPEDVDTVLLTHAHPDHLCGLVKPDGSAAYPNATVWLAAEDARYWLDPQMQAQAPQGLRPMFDMARRAVAPYEAAGRLKRFAAGDALPSGVRALDTGGHTPGHTSWLIEGGNGQQLLVWGDVVHFHAVQFVRPEVSYEYDTDHRRAVASRRAMLALAERSGAWVAGAHLPFPGMGHVRKQGGGYRWIPAEYSPVPGDAK